MTKLNAKHFKSVIKMRSTMLLLKNCLKNSIDVLGGRRTASWPTVAGTSEFLNHLPKNVL
jgi:hypothetical protein